MLITRCSSILLFIVCTQTVSAETKRQHDSHEHGTAKLDIVLEKNELHIVLDTPAANIIGFEYEPKTSKEKTLLHKATAQLKKGAELFTAPKIADCRLLNIDVESPFATDEQDHEEHEHTKHEHDKEHADKEGHADFMATWRFGCKQMKAIDKLNINLFDKFSNMQRLQVQFISSGRQGSAILRPSNPVLTF